MRSNKMAPDAATARSNHINKVFRYTKTCEEELVKQLSFKNQLRLLK